MLLAWTTPRPMAAGDGFSAGVVLTSWAVEPVADAAGNGTIIAFG
ncbi:hypothetical protein [Synechococcus sp. BA-132 BA5]|nr:hypothetical protein [Synechococcus sp. BA-132 BA5]MEA5414604.1 hypothetical protein [Synechococcus sp. BA-132 BA5]